MSKHTPGPWEVDFNEKGYPYAIIAPKADNMKPGAVGTCITRWAAISLPSSEEGQANARLIAASPEMLAALKSASLVLMGCAGINDENELERAEAIATARAAIAKAEGVRDE